MQKTFLTLAVFLFLTAKSSATNVSGLINTNTTWTKANSPYIVKGDIAIDTGASLTIEPGVEVRFDGNYTIYAYGKIMAMGTASDSIIITSNKTTPKIKDWRGIDIQYTSTNDTIKFTYCRISYGGNVAVRIRSNPAIIKHCKFTYNDVALQANSAPESYTHISYSQFLHNNFGADLSSRNIITQCEFSYGGWGIANGIYNIETSYNKFYNNSHTAAGYCHNVHHNIFAYNKNAVSHCNRTKHNQIWYNEKGIDGILLNHDDTIEHNSIKYNDIGVRGVPSSRTVFKNNCIENNKQYDYYNGESIPSDVSMNYWGTTDSATIDKRIYDFYDNLTSGKTTFIPLLLAGDSACADTVALPSLSIKNNAVYNAAIVKVYPNPMGDKLTIASTNQIAAITITDITGKAILQQNINNTKATIRTDGLASGVYLYKIFHTDDAISTGKLLKE